MNSNRNNRRRGRGNRNQGGGANQLNRIDSRARGNAPQLLDKYKKLAQDAQHNGDRVQAEYYLQFADHYFRVIADNKARQEEQRAKRQEERDQSGDEADDDGDDRRRSRRGRGPKDNPKENQRDNRRQEHSEEGERGVEGEPIEGSGENSDADQADGDGAKPRRARGERQPRRKPREQANGSAEADASSDGEIDVAALPPAIGGDSDGTEASAKPKPQLKPRRSRKPKDEGGDDDGLQAVG